MFLYIVNVYGGLVKYLIVLFGKSVVIVFVVTGERFIFLVIYLKILIFLYNKKSLYFLDIYFVLGVKLIYLIFLFIL